jgi:hypothetical protein
MPHSFSQGADFAAGTQNRRFPWSAAPAALECGSMLPLWSIAAL